MNKRVAVMDLGTNTFHLLIAEGSAASYREIVHRQEAVKLGEGGINKGYILPEAYKRGLDTMLQFHEQIQASQVQEVRGVRSGHRRG